MFLEGADYSRTIDIHGRFGGQRQGGISTPAKLPYVFIFTGKSGEMHGYNDGWREDGVFLYTGEGQVGDMRFVAGNRAIRDHAHEGKDLFLFEALGKGKPVRFVGRFACASWGTFRGKDREGNDRECIQFHLVKLPSEVPLTPQPPLSTRDGATLAELRKRAIEAAKPVATKNYHEAPQSYRLRSDAVRLYVLARAGGVCELTGRKAPFLTPSGQPYLEVHHLRRLSDDGPDDPAFVAAIGPDVHREIHFGAGGSALNEKLQRIVTAKEQQITRYLV